MLKRLAIFLFASALSGFAQPATIDETAKLLAGIPVSGPLAPLMHIPFTMPLWRWGYRQVAKRRYFLGKTADACASEACKVHLK